MLSAGSRSVDDRWAGVDPRIFSPDVEFRGELTRGAGRGGQDLGAECKPPTAGEAVVHMPALMDSNGSCPGIAITRACARFTSHSRR